LQSCPDIVLQFEIVLILAIVAQQQFNVVIAALLICLLHMWIRFYVLFLLTCFLQLSFLCNVALVIVMAPFGCFMTNLWYVKRNDFLRFETLKCPAIVLKFAKNVVLKFHYFLLEPVQ